MIQNNIENTKTCKTLFFSVNKKLIYHETSYRLALASFTFLLYSIILVSRDDIFVLILLADSRLGVPRPRPQVGGYLHHPLGRGLGVAGQEVVPAHQPVREAQVAEGALEVEAVAEEDLVDSKHELLVAEARGAAAATLVRLGPGVGQGVVPQSVLPSEGLWWVQ